MIERNDVYEALRKIIDPELGVDIVSLGFVYGVEIDDGRCKIVMTLTTPGCPLASIIKDMVNETVGVLDGVDSVEIEFVFDPPWTKDMMSEEARLKLGF